jgi:alginate O-acetyltransferase complex protein AlgI
VQFNSFGFLLLFLPVALGLHVAVQRWYPTWRTPLLLVLSLVFYGWWDLRFVPLLAASIALNWLAAEAYLRTGRAAWLTLAIVLDLLALGFFKYLGFAAGLVLVLVGAEPTEASRFALALPLGISFFTFQHIMYLVDLKAGRAERASLLDYALYVAFFPRVLAGPLVRWSEFAPQFARSGLPRDALERGAQGLMLLTIGLVKKVFVGDPLAGIASPTFDAAARGEAPTVSEAYEATLAYTFQIYFDFSGYTDMALGVALLFGVLLPQNFDAPYRAASLQDFWRRWHITLSRFLRDYVYIPLGGNRHGMPRQLWALFATMTLGGLWHGAGLTFVAWGVAHGLGLGAVVLWQRADFRMPALLAWALTFAFVALTWVLFRAESFGAALAVFRGLAGLAPLGDGFDPRLILVAAAIAILGPTSWTMVAAARPARWTAVALGLGFAAVLLAVGNDGNQTFIYQQF